MISDYTDSGPVIVVIDSTTATDSTNLVRELRRLRYDVVCLTSDSTDSNFTDSSISERMILDCRSSLIDIGFMKQLPPPDPVEYPPEIERLFRLGMPPRPNVRDMHHHPKWRPW